MKETNPVQSLREKRDEIQDRFIEDKHPGWRQWTKSCYSQELANAIHRKVEQPHLLSEDQLEQACLALGITKLPRYD